MEVYSSTKIMSTSREASPDVVYKIQRQNNLNYNKRKLEESELFKKTVPISIWIEKPY